jgi:hypothetical protein
MAPETVVAGKSATVTTHFFDGAQEWEAIRNSISRSSLNSLEESRGTAYSTETNDPNTGFRKRLPPAAEDLDAQQHWARLRC